jgi:hypothetical protein
VNSPADGREQSKPLTASAKPLRAWSSRALEQPIRTVRGYGYALDDKFAKTA